MELQLLLTILMFVTCAKSSLVVLPGVVPPVDRCWPYASDSVREQLFTRQVRNQRTFYRTTESFWCAHTNGLTGNVLNLEDLRDYNLVDQPSNAQLVRVQWNNGIVAVHRMGVNSKYDLDTRNFSSGVLATFTAVQLQAALRPGTVVVPTRYNFPYTDWLEICNSGLTGLSHSTGTYHSYNNARRIAVVAWKSIFSNASTLGFHRYGNGDFDLCFSGCSDFGQYSLSDFGSLFQVCSILAPSPDLLQSTPNSEVTVGHQFVVIPPHFVGIDVLNATSRSDFIYIANSSYENITFVNALSSSICIYDNAACPKWANMRLADLLALMPNGSVISSLVPGRWRGRVIWPPGTVTTQQPGSLFDTFLSASMGENMTFDYCLSSSKWTDCPRPLVPSPTDAPVTTVPPTTAPPQCTLDLVELFYVILVPLSAVCIIYLSLRKPGKPFRLQLKLSPVAPVNLLDFRIDRVLIAVAYIATVQIVFLMFTGNLQLHITTANSVIQQKWLSVAVTILLTLVIGFSFYVVFAGMTTHHQPEGTIMGLVFSILFILFYSLRISSCVASSQAELILQAAPAFLCLGILAVYFFIRLVRYVLAMANRDDMVNLLARYEFGRSTKCELPYLRSLLKRRFVEKKLNELHREMADEKISVSRSVLRRLWKTIVAFMKDNFPIPTRKDTFSYSPAFLSSILLGLVCVYMLLVVMVPPIYSIFSSVQNLTQLTDNEVARDILNVIPASSLLSTLIATLLIILHSLHMLRCYKRHMTRLYRGDSSFMAHACPPPLTQMKAYGRFLGLQAGYIIWGFYIKVFLFLLVILILSAIILLLKYLAFARSIFYSYVLTAVGVSVVTFIIIHLMVSFTRDSTAPGRYAVIKHKAVYHNIVYFFVFYNIVLGVVSVLLRMLFVAAFNTVMLMRLNRPLMPRGWERWDFGYAAYCGFLRMELAHTHPCMLAFVSLLKEEADRPFAMKQSKAVRRWHLAYTLVRNPDLISLRHRYLGHKAGRESGQRQILMHSISMTTSSDHLLPENTSLNATLSDSELRKLYPHTEASMA
ncbi:uncharacterized protein LOC135805410 isoform X2 [Sycon ciliatum]|uniref:uncharacterized protein LOC135805410 isoform X2 n=1 Tax=Sycon ciliatum TaxID=27933 RepID=UPI0031F69B9C